jgi:hypothetical protein
MGTKALTWGMLVGAALIAALVSYLVFDSSGTVVATVETSTTTTQVQSEQPGVTYAGPGEIALGPAVLVPTDVTVSGRETSVLFDLVHLAPVQGLPTGFTFVPFQGFQEVPVEQAYTVFPDKWTLTVDGGVEVSGTVANPTARAARFNIPDGVTASRVESVRIDSYQIWIPLDQHFVLSTAEPEVEVVPGVVATLVQVSEQASTTIVRVELSHSDPASPTSGFSGLDLRAIGERAIVSAREAGGAPVWSLTYESPPSDEIRVTLVGSMWFDVEGPWNVDVGGTNG